MYEPMKICKQIRAIYPEVGQCGIGLTVHYDEVKTAWIVGLELEGKRLTTHLEPDDARDCIEGKRCVSLGTQIGQLVANLKQTPA